MKSLFGKEFQKIDSEPGPVGSGPIIPRSDLGKYHRYTCSRTGRSHYMNYNFWGRPVGGGLDHCGGGEESWRARGHI